MNKVPIVLSIGVILHLGSFVLMLLRIEPFYSFFYILAWWSYILMLSCLNHLFKRNSLLIDQSTEFLWMVGFSIVVWLFFEAYNFRLQNWHYLGVPFERVLRWPGYLIAYGTVLPGIFETERLLQNLSIFKDLKGRGIQINKALKMRLIALGVMMLVAPLIRPQICFPLVWLGFIFLIDPLLYGGRRGTHALLYQAERGRYGGLVRMMSAGMICGVLWEFWNYWAGSKWIYSIPLFDYFHVFEMPILGFLGFAFFALESFLLYQVFTMIRRRLLQSKVLLITAIVLVAGYSAMILHGIDEWTVVTYKMVLH